jgi:hypothetical protein
LALDNGKTPLFHQRSKAFGLTLKGIAVWA